jgi:hypothetical protein
MRNLMAVLVAMLIATGTAHATWYWSPLSTVLPLGDSARTADNNARCIVGSGGIIHVVYNRNFKIGDQSYIKVFYSRSSDIGFTWSGPVQLSNSQGAYDSKSPSIGRWDDDNLLVIWSDGDVDHPQTGISVKSCYSTDGNAGTLPVFPRRTGAVQDVFLRPALCGCSVLPSLSPSSLMKVRLPSGRPVASHDAEALLQPLVLFST